MDWNQRVREAFDAAGQRVDSSVLEELADHVEELDANLAARGLTPDARAAAVDEHLCEWVRDAAGSRLRPVTRRRDQHARRPAGIVRVLRYAAMSTRRHPGPFAIGVFTIAVAIAGVGVMAALTWTVLLEPLPWPDSDRLVRVYESREGGAGFGQFGRIVTNAAYLAWQQRPGTIESIAAWNGGEHTLTGSGPAERVRTADVTPSFFTVLRARPRMGRAFTSADAAPHAPPVALVSYSFWKDHLAGRKDVLGSTVRLDGVSSTIVGVMDGEFDFPSAATAIWKPLTVAPPPLGDTVAPGTSLLMLQAVARLKPNATIPQARAEAITATRGMPLFAPIATAVFGSTGPPVITLVPLADDATREVRPALLVLIAAVGLLLAAASANVANVQLARAAVRRHELTVRCALGASPRQLAAQLLFEGVIVGLCGAGVGLLAAWGVLHALRTLLPGDFPRLEQLGLGWQAAAVALLVSVTAGMVAALIPALRAGRLATAGVLVDNGRGPLAIGDMGRGTRTRGIVMAAQVAIATVLLAGAAVLARGFVALVRIDRGFETGRVLAAQLPITGERNHARQTEILDAIVDRIDRVPGVLAAGHTTILPLSGSESMYGFEIPGESGERRLVRAGFRVVSRDYFTALGMRLVEGRLFSDHDTAMSRPALIVTRAFATAYLHRHRIGTVVALGDSKRMPNWQIVGIVEDVRSAEGTPAGPEMFALARQWPTVEGGDPYIVVRTAGDPGELASLVRGIVRGVEPSLALGEVSTMEERVLQLLAKPRLYTVMLGAFAAAALAIAAVGLFGVLSFSVAQRSHELAVRGALGASPAVLVRLVLRQGLGVTLAGVAIGTCAAIALTGYAGSQLHGVSGRDPLVYVIVGALLLVTATLACVVPAKRAARLDPAEVLRRG